MANPEIPTITWTPGFNERQFDSYDWYGQDNEGRIESFDGLSEAIELPLSMGEFEQHIGVPSFFVELKAYRNSPVPEDDDFYDDDVDCLLEHVANIRVNLAEFAKTHESTREMMEAE